MKENEWKNKWRIEWKNQWKSESKNEKKKVGVVSIVNCESQTYRTLKQRYCNGLVNIRTNTLEIVNIYTVIQEQWIFTLWWSDEWMNEWKKMNEKKWMKEWVKNEWMKEWIKRWMKEWMKE